MKNKAVHMLAFSPHPIDTELGIGVRSTTDREAKKWFM